MVLCIADAATCFCSGSRKIMKPLFLQSQPICRFVFGLLFYGDIKLGVVDYILWYSFAAAEELEEKLN